MNHFSGSSGQKPFIIRRAQPELSGTFSKIKTIEGVNPVPDRAEEMSLEEILARVKYIAAKSVLDFETVIRQGKALEKFQIDTLDHLNGIILKQKKEERERSKDPALNRLSPEEITEELRRRGFLKKEEPEDE
jgi:hypothetical protein